MVSLQTKHIPAIFFPFLVFCAASHADVEVKIKNNSTRSVDYLVDNFKYDDSERKWKVLPANSSATETVEYTSKYGHLELRIKERGQERLIYSYTPTGTNPEVTLVIEDTDDPNRLKVSKKKTIE